LRGLQYVYMGLAQSKSPSDSDFRGLLGKMVFARGLIVGAALVATGAAFPLNASHAASRLPARASERAPPATPASVKRSAATLGPAWDTVGGGRGGDARDYDNGDLSEEERSRRLVEVRSTTGAKFDVHRMPAPLWRDPLYDGAADPTVIKGTRSPCVPR